MRLQAIGLYLPLLDEAALASFIEQRVQDFRTEKRKLGWDGAELEDYLPELAEELQAELPEAAIVEISVTESTGHLFPSRIHTRWTEDFGEESVFLLPSGNVVEPDVIRQRATGAFTIVLLIYRWEPGNALEGDYGPLSLPLPKKVPDRIWRAIGNRLGSC